VQVGAACAVVVLDGDDVLLERQPRFAVDAEMLEIVKGGGAAGESALDCARRETREEIGVEAGRWDPLGACIWPAIVRSFPPAPKGSSRSSGCACPLLGR
jgi:8-oxo-dGTP pyrophosphatase MutT (NUDIX family)